MELLSPLGWYLLVVIFCFGLFHYHSEPQIVSLPIVFNACALLYFFLGISLRSIVGLQYAELLFKLALYAVLAFNIGYILVRNYASAHSSFKLNESDLISNEVLWILLGIALFAELIIIVSVGFHDFFLIDRYQRFPLLKKYQPLLFIANISMIVLPLSMVRYLSIGDTSSKYLFYVCALHNIVFAFLLVSRSEILMFFVSIVYVMEAFGLVRKRTIILFSVLLISSMFIIRGVLYFLILDSGEFVNINPGEIVNWIRNSEVLLENRVTGRDLPENSYVLALKSLFIISPSADAPAEWLVKTFFRDAVPGYTRGFSGLLEGYLYLKELGVILHFFFIGVIFSLLQNIKKLLFFILILFFCYASFRLFRSEAYNFVKYMQWYYVIPLGLIFLFDHILRRVYGYK